jgi:hypothetical protein
MDRNHAQDEKGRHHSGLAALLLELARRGSVGIPSDGINHQVQDLVIVIPFQSFDQKLDVSHVPVEIPSTHIGRGASTESTLVLAGQILARTRCSQQSQTTRQSTAHRRFDIRARDPRLPPVQWLLHHGRCELTEFRRGHEQVSIQCWRGRHLVIHAFSQTGTPTVFFCSLACDFRVCRRLKSTFRNSSD